MVCVHRGSHRDTPLDLGLICEADSTHASIENVGKERMSGDKEFRGWSDSDVGGIPFLFLSVMIPLFTQTRTNWETEHKTVPIEGTLLAFALLICGIVLVAVELASGGVVYTKRRKKNQDAHRTGSSF